MIILRYLASNIYRGGLLVLLILVSLSLFFTFIRELDDVGRGGYGLPQMIGYLLFKAPTFMVDYMPLAALLGGILSLGNLASRSEVIALMASGLSVRQLVIGVCLSVAGLAVISVLLANLVVPETEAQARQLRSLRTSSEVSLQSRNGVWIKDENNIVFIQRLFPGGNAEKVEIHSLDDQGQLTKTLRAERAVIHQDGWLLQEIQVSNFTGSRINVSRQQEQTYHGGLSRQLLTSLAVDPRQMSLTDLYTYVDFLRANDLDLQAASLNFWRKVYAPFGIVVMGLLAVPFVLGSQRQANTGQRIMTGIMLGLLYVVLDRLLIQAGEQLRITASINAILPTLFFLLLTLGLIHRKSRA